MSPAQQFRGGGALLSLSTTISKTIALVLSDVQHYIFFAVWVVSLQKYTVARQLYVLFVIKNKELELSISQPLSLCADATDVVNASPHDTGPTIVHSSSRLNSFFPFFLLVLT